MSYTYLQESGEESSAASFSDIEQSVLLNLNLTADESCSKGSGTESCQSSQSGTMSAPSMELRGEEKSMLFAEDSLAKTSQLLGKVMELTEEEAGYGEKWPESLAKYNPNTFSWRTRQCLLFEDLAELLETFPNWGIMQDGECWAVIPPEIVVMANESGFSLMRPIASDGLRHRFKVESLIRVNHGDGNLTEQLARVYRLKLTPLACEILMQFPEMWTDLNQLEMHKFQSWQQQHSEFLKENK
jgi:hypothetical protein